MAVLIVTILLGFLLLLHSVGVLPNFSVSSDVVWRWFLNTLLVLGAIGLLSKAWSIIVVFGHLDSGLLISPSRDPMIDITSTSILAVALYGIWRRRKWGAYLVFARLAFTIVAQVFIYQSLDWRLARNYTGLDNVLADVIGAAMWLLAFSRTWATFT